MAKEFEFSAKPKQLKILKMNLASILTKGKMNQSQLI